MPGRVIPTSMAGGGQERSGDSVRNFAKSQKAAAHCSQRRTNLEDKGRGSNYFPPKLVDIDQLRGGEKKGVVKGIEGVGKPERRKGNN